MVMVMRQSTVQLPTGDGNSVAASETCAADTSPAICRRSRTMSRPAMPAARTSLQLTVDSSMNRSAIVSSTDAANPGALAASANARTSTAASASTSISTGAWHHQHSNGVMIERSLSTPRPRRGKSMLHIAVSVIRALYLPTRSCHEASAADEQP